MTPRALDWRSVEPKLHKIDELLELLVELGPVEEAGLRSDLRTAMIVERALSLTVELAVSINNHVVVALTGRVPEDYSNSFERSARAGLIDPELARSLAPSAGMRNVLVHAYLEVDHDMVAAAVPIAIRQYREYVRQVAAWFTARQSDAGST